MHDRLGVEPIELPEQGAGPYSIGSDVWPGLSKLAEECGEVLQVVGKIIGAGGAPVHWDGQALARSLSDELGDLTAAIDYVAQQNRDKGLHPDTIRARSLAKWQKFMQWHHASVPVRR